MTSDRAPSAVPPHVLAYLDEHQTLTLATASATGTPHAATLLYANDDRPAVYCWTRRETTTARHLTQNPQVAFAVDAYVPDWRQTKGIQGMGTAQLLPATEIERVVSLFRRKFPALAAAPTDDLAFVEITPTELRFIDNAEAAAVQAPSASGVELAPQALGQAYRHRVVLDADRHAADATAPDASALASLVVPAGTVIVRQGTPADTFYIVVDGEVAVIHEENGRDRQVATLRRGQFFGEMAILRDMPRTATVRALTPATLMTLDREAFRDLVGQSAGTTADFDRIIRERLAGLGVVAAPAGEAI